MLILIILLSLGLRLLPVIKSPLSTYGYDYGFYLDVLKKSSAFSWESFLTAVQGGYGNPLFFLVYHLPWSPDISLSILHFLFSLGLPVACYFFFLKENKRAACFAAFFSAVSLLELEVYRMFLLKTLIAAPFLVLAFKFLREKKYLAMLACSLVIFLAHRTTSIIYLLTLLLYFVYELIRTKRFVGLTLGLGAAGTTAALARPHFEPVIQNFLSLSNAHVQTGIFLPGQNIALLLLPMFFLAALGAILYLREKPHAALPIFAGLLLVWIVLELPFYRRLWIYFELALILFAAYGLGNFTFGTKKLKTALVLLTLFFTLTSVTFVKAFNPLITSSELWEIKNFKGDGHVLALSAADYPWLLGFKQQNRGLFAPGFFSDPHNLQEWQNFWSGKNQGDFFARYPKPLYIYERSYKASNSVDCLKKISENFFLSSC